jgi:hypothetical protein
VEAAAACGLIQAGLGGHRGTMEKVAKAYTGM